MRPVYLAYIFLFSLLLSSCEKVIDIPLNSASPVIVIEGTITTFPGPYRVIISQTTNYYKPGNIIRLSGAFVYVRDNEGNYWNFFEKKRGIYENMSFLGRPGITYSLEVEYKGRRYTASSVMQQPVPIDSLQAQYFPGTRFADPGHFIIIYFTDPPGKGNYYRIRTFRSQKASTAIYVMDDQLTDGNQIKFLLYGAAYQPGDTAIVELQAIDKGVYEYMLTLSKVSATNPPNETATPANPVTNLSGGALGYFGALALSRDTLVIK